jgi:hypothetical protein
MPIDVIDMDVIDMDEIDFAEFMEAAWGAEYGRTLDLF